MLKEKENNLDSIWIQAIKDFNLETISPFVLTLPNAEKVKANLLVKNYGAKNGMLIVDDYSKISFHIDEIISMGYGFSILSFDKEEKYSKNSFKDMLSDWGLADENKS